MTGTVAINGSSAGLDDTISDIQTQIDTVTSDVVASLDKDGYLTFTSSATCAVATFTVNTFTENDTAALNALGLVDGVTTAYADLTFNASGADSSEPTCDVSMAVTYAGSGSSMSRTLLSMAMAFSMSM